MALFYLIVIVLCLGGMMLLFGMKIREMRTGEAGTLGRLSMQNDQKLVTVVTNGKTLLSHVNLTNVRDIARIGAHGFFNVCGTLGLFVSKYYEKFMSRMKGKRFLKEGGIVSFFLKDVAESKGVGENHESRIKNQE